MIVTPDFRLLANYTISQSTPYQPGKPTEELERELGITSSIKLASNENPLGPGPKAVAAAAQALTEAHIYPDGSSYILKQAIAKHFSVHPEQITTGNGSENILELIIKAYLQQNDSAVISQYAFLTIPILLKNYGVRIKEVKAVNYGHDIHAMCQAVDTKTRVLFLVNPNNPTGTYTNDHEFKTLMDALPPYVLVVADEAYAEYMDQADYPQTINYLSRYPNLIITRTFSKAYGLAGLRIGYAISSHEIADILNRARLPFNVNHIASRAACAALNDTEHLQKTLIVNHRGKEQIQAGLQKLKLSYISSVGNFITIRVAQAATLYQKLLHKGIIVRPLTGYHLPEYIRVTLSTEVHNEQFLSALHECLS